MTTTAVVKCHKSEPGPDSTQLHFSAAYDNPANQEWSKYTPALSISMHVKNEVAEVNFDDGAEYLLTFEKREETDG